MKKKLIIGLLSATFVLGAGTFAFAQSNGSDNGLFNFEVMRPLIEKMHPDFTEKEQREMFDACHGSNGMMQNQDQDSNMMNNF